MAPIELPATYIVKAGDTLWERCVDFYGDGNYDTRLADFNEMEEIHLTDLGDTLTIPAPSELGG